MHRQFPEEVEEEEVVEEAVHPVPQASLNEEEVLDLVVELALELLGEVVLLEPEVELEVESVALVATERTAAATAIPKSPSRCTAVA